MSTLYVLHIHSCCHITSMNHGPEISCCSCLGMEAAVIHAAQARHRRRERFRSCLELSRPLVCRVNGEPARLTHP